MSRLGASRSLFNFIAEPLRDPRAFIAGTIAMGPLAAHGFVFAVIFNKTDAVFNVISGLMWSTLLALLGHFYGRPRARPQRAVCGGLAR